MGLDFVYKSIREAFDFEDPCRGTLSLERHFTTSNVPFLMSGAISSSMALRKPAESGSFRASVKMGVLVGLIMEYRIAELR